VNRSSHRRETFLNLQPKDKAVVPIQDVRTRWNSTYLMLQRAKRLRSVFDEYCLQWNCPELKLSQEEWRQVDYLLWLTHPFFKFTTALSKTRDVTVHTVFSIYNRLFDHLDQSIEKISPKTVAWKQLMKNALIDGRQKLRDYYYETDLVPNDLYAIATVMEPRNKFQFFNDKDWDDYRDDYRKSLREMFESYQQRVANTERSTQAQSVGQRSELELLLAPQKPWKSNSNRDDELTRYLGSGMYILLLYWARVNQFNRYYHTKRWHSRILEGSSI